MNTTKAIKDMGVTELSDYIQDIDELSFPELTHKQLEEYKKELVETLLDKVKDNREVKHDNNLIHYVADRRGKASALRVKP